MIVAGCPGIFKGRIIVIICFQSRDPGEVVDQKLIIITRRIIAGLTRHKEAPVGDLVDQPGCGLDDALQSIFRRLVGVIPLICDELVLELFQG